MHASWNALAKRSADPLAFLTALGGAGLIAYAVPAGLMLARHGLPASALPFMVASAALEITYVFTLAAAYRHGALALTYPAARGTSVLLVPLLAILLLGERPSPAALSGIGLILAGLLTINVLAARGRAAQELIARRRGVVFALLTGCVIAAYSLVDKSGVARAHPLVYVYGVIGLTTLGAAGWSLRYRRAELARELRDNPRAIAIGGVLNMGAYLIVLAAMRIANVSYIVPLRETSIVFATLLGITALHERVGHIRLAGCALVATGVLAIALGG